MFVRLRTAIVIKLHMMKVKNFLLARAHKWSGSQDRLLDTWV